MGPFGGARGRVGTTWGVPLVSNSAPAGSRSGELRYNLFRACILAVVRSLCKLSV